MSFFEYRAAVAHGGNLGDAAHRYGIPRADWVDLSTGINPHGYPIPTIAPEAWLRLPEDDDGLEEAAAMHYGAGRAVAVAGSQAAIRLLPQLLAPGPVGVGLLTYGEYAPAFERAGFPVHRFVTEPLADRRSDADFVLAAGQPLPPTLKYLVVVNPNNPGTELFAPDVLRQWQSELAARGGTLIVDEAFIEATPEGSVARYVDEAGWVVLRSVGKFFGLAGARAGFVLMPPVLDAALRAARGPWTVAGPARAVVRAALADEGWQRETRLRLAASSARLGELLERHGLRVRRTALFAWVRDGDAPRIHDALARQGVWVRRFDTVSGLRFGLPADEAAWARLDAALCAACGNDNHRN